MRYETWHEAFVEAIAAKNILQIGRLLKTLPDFENNDQRREALAMSMDAETLLNTAYLELVEKREELRKIHTGNGEKMV